jgi:hypothetical protein
LIFTLILIVCHDSALVVFASAIALFMTVCYNSALVVSVSLPFALFMTVCLDSLPVVFVSQPSRIVDDRWLQQFACRICISHRIVYDRVLRQFACRTYIAAISHRIGSFVTTVCLSHLHQPSRIV